MKFVVSVWLPPVSVAYVTTLRVIVVQLLTTSFVRLVLRAVRMLSRLSHPRLSLIN